MPVRSTRDLSNTKRIFKEIGMFGGFEVPIRPDELKLSLFVEEFFIGKDICRIYEEYTRYLAQFCYGILNRSRYIRSDICIRSNIKNLMYYNVYFQHKIKFLCKDVSKQRPKVCINNDDYNIDDNGVLIAYFDYKNGTCNHYGDFIISHIAIIRDKIEMSRSIQRDRNMNSVLRVNRNSDKFDTLVEACDKYYRVASIRLKHPILTVDNYEKIDNLSELLYDD
jgi:hypothetical protein